MNDLLSERGPRLSFVVSISTSLVVEQQPRDEAVSNAQVLAAHHLVICRHGRDARLILCALCGLRACASGACLMLASPTNPVPLPVSATARLSLSNMGITFRL